MRPKSYFKLEQIIIADSFTGQKIIGKYRGRSNSFGALVYGHPVDTSEENRLYKCITLTMRASTDTKHTRKNSDKIKFINGESCVGLHSSGQKVTGFFVQSEGKYAWIRGWLDSESKFDSQRVHRVSRDSLSHR